MADGSQASIEQEHTPDEVDVIVGSWVRVRRKELGVSQAALAEALGVSFQQVQKYERGSNRVSSSVLYKTASHLRVPISYFFQGLPDPEGTEGPDPDTLTLAKIMSEELIPEITLTLSHMTVEARKFIRLIAGEMQRMKREGIVVEPATQPVEVKRPGGRGQQKSPARVKLEELATMPVGTEMKFKFGAFSSPKSAMQKVAAIGGSQWATVTPTAQGCTIKKVAEPRR